MICTRRNINAILLNVKINRPKLVNICGYKLLMNQQNFMEISSAWMKILQNIFLGGTVLIHTIDVTPWNAVTSYFWEHKRIHTCCAEDFSPCYFAYSVNYCICLVTVSTLFYIGSIHIPLLFRCVIICNVTFCLISGVQEASIRHGLWWVPSVSAASSAWVCTIQRRCRKASTSIHDGCSRRRFISWPV